MKNALQRDVIWWGLGLGLGTLVFVLLPGDFRSHLAGLIEAHWLDGFMEMVKSGYNYLCS